MKGRENGEAEKVERMDAGRCEKGGTDEVE